ncbi:MAG: hypothetical protein C6I00_07015 [Nitratiruptor sp.]|nr:hypothetical protein [Nitratiruptor sp.]NPA83787.1 hypothetical protein [Campylobacterota bacterium]
MEATNLPVEVIVLLLLELYELSWQQANTIKGLLERTYLRYKEGIFYFFLSHPSFYYALYVGLKYGLTNIWFLALLFLKFMDISYKLVLIKKLEENRLHEALPIPPETPITPSMRYLNLLLYPLLLFLAMQP